MIAVRTTGVKLCISARIPHNIIQNNHNQMAIRGFQLSYFYLSLKASRKTTQNSEYVSRHMPPILHPLINSNHIYVVIYRFAQGL